MTAEEPTPGSRVIHRFPRIATDARSVWPHEGTDVRDMGGVVMDGETAETLADVVRLLWRGGQFAWVRAEVEGRRSPRQLVALGERCAPPFPDAAAACITCREPFSYDGGTHTHPTSATAQSEGDDHERQRTRTRAEVVHRRSGGESAGLWRKQSADADHRWGPPFAERRSSRTPPRAGSM